MHTKVRGNLGKPGNHPSWPSLGYQVVTGSSALFILSLTVCEGYYSFITKGAFIFRRHTVFCCCCFFGFYFVLLLASGMGFTTCASQAVFCATVLNPQPHTGCF